MKVAQYLFLSYCIVEILDTVNVPIILAGKNDTSEVVSIVRFEMQIDQNDSMKCPTFDCCC